MRQRLRLKNKHRSWTALQQSQGWTRKSWLYVLLQMKGLINLGISLINFFFPFAGVRVEFLCYETRSCFGAQTVLSCQSSCLSLSAARAFKC